LLRLLSLQGTLANASLLETLAAMIEAFELGEASELRQRDVRQLHLLRNPGTPSPRAAIISKAHQRLWHLRVDGMDILPKHSKQPSPRDGSSVDAEIKLGAEYGPEYADRTFNMSPLLKAPRRDEDKLEQLLRWLEDQGM